MGDKYKLEGHEVYDFRGEEGFSWREVDEAWASWTPEQYLAGLQHPCAERGFKRDMDALLWCEACVYVMPCGPSASMEMGFARGQEKLVIAYIPALREPDLMVKMAHLITDKLEDVRERLLEYQHSRRVALATLPQRERREAGWLIERQGPEWLAGFGFSANWTKDSLEAIRFARRKDAEKIAEVLENEDISITEHIWG